MAELFGPVCDACGHHDPSGGEYGIKAPFSAPPTICDVGACVGAFARWSLMFWPEAEVHCYEPNPRALKILRRNVAECPLVTVHEYAVTVERTGNVMLYQGANNLGEASTSQEMAQTYDGVPVGTVPIDDLPQCDVLKLDCGGHEPELFGRYLATHEPPAVVLAEYHSPADMLGFTRRSAPAGYRIVKVSEHSFSRGVIGMRHDASAKWSKVA